MYRYALVTILLMSITCSVVQGQTPRLVIPAGHNAFLFSARFSKDGKKVVTTSFDQTAKVWEANTGRLLATLPSASVEVEFADFSPDGKKVITGIRVLDTTVAIWDVASGNLLFNLSHPAQVIYCQFSADGKMVITACDDNTIKLWDASTGQLLKTMSDRYFRFDHVDYSSKTGKLITSGDSKNYPLSIWDVNTGTLEGYFGGSEGLQDLAQPAKISPDGKHILTINKSGVVQVWQVPVTQSTTLGSSPGANSNPDTFQARQVQVNEPANSQRETEVNNSPDTTGMISSRRGRRRGGGNGTYNTTTVSIPPKLVYPSLVFGTQPNKEKIIEAHFSPDSKTVLTRTETGQIEVLQLAKGTQLWKFKADTGKLNSITFFPQGDKIVTCGFDSRFKIWDINKRKLLYQIKDTITNSVQFSPDGKKLLTFAPTADGIGIWNAENGQRISTLKGHSLEAQAEKILKKDLFLLKFLSYYEGKELRPKLLDLQNLSLIDYSPTAESKTNNSEETYPRGSVVSPDKKSYAVYEKDSKTPDSTIEIWNIYPRVKTFHLKCSSQIKQAKFSPDSKTIFILCKEKIMVWDIASQKLKSEIPQDIVATLTWDEETREHKPTYKEKCNYFDISPDSKKLISVENDKATVWDIERNTVLFTLRPEFPRYEFSEIPANFPLFTPNSQKIMLGDDERETNKPLIFVYDADAGNFLYSLKYIRSSLQYNQDSTLFAGNPMREGLLIGDANSGFIVREIRPEDKFYHLNDFNFDTDQAIFSNRNDMRVYSLSTGAHLFSLWFSNDDYLVLLPSGYYFSTPGASKLLHYVTPDQKVVSFDQLDIKYNRPDIVLKALNSDQTTLIDSYQKAYEKRIRKLGIDTSFFGDNFGVPEADFVDRDKIEVQQKRDQLTLRIKGKDSTYQIDRFNVWINEVPLYGLKGISLRSKHSHTLDTTISLKLSHGKNVIETSITNVNGTESYRMPLTVTFTLPTPQKAKKYFIGIGIDRFTDSTQNLNYSVKDVRDLAKKLKEKYKSDIIIDTLFNEAVSVENITALKKKLFTSSVNDQVILSYSGHGLLSKEYDYYLSTYAVDFNNPEIGGLPYQALESLLDSIPARKKLMLIDACHSGEVDKEEMTKYTQLLSDKKRDGLKGMELLHKDRKASVGMKNSFELMQQLFVNVGRSTGATIISAAAGTQMAQERGDLKNGVFTYSILEYMKQNQSATVSELKLYVNKRVPELTNGMQVPTTRTETKTIDWKVW